MEKYECWVNEDDRIISFHPVLEFLYRTFPSYDEFIKYVMDTIDRLRYRIQ